MIIQNAIEIDAPAKRVFYWLEDPERAMRWMTSVSKGEVLEEVPGRVGTKFREVVEEGGKGLEMTGEIAAWEENHRIGFHLESKVNTTDVEFILVEQGGVTRLTQKAEVSFKGALKILSMLFEAKLKKQIKCQAEEEFAELKRLCESEK